MKKILCVFACIMALALAGCAEDSQWATDGAITPTQPRGTEEPRPDDVPAGVDTSGFQKEMNVQHPFRLSAVCKTELGYYLTYDAFLYFLDGATGNMTVVCGRPECSHTDNTCSAWVNTKMLSYYQGKLYYENGDAKSDSMTTLYSVEMNGTNHTKLQRLQMEFMPYRTVKGEPILVNGSLYFLEGDSKIYTVPLGEDVSKAVLLFEDDMSRKLESSWKFWADGNIIYAMNRMLDRTGYYLDVLYKLGQAEAETREIWRSTQVSESAADASWYLSGGHLYYYPSGKDLWDIDLGTGDARKMIELTDTVKGATALFTDACFILLDDQPDSRWPGQSIFREGGRRITVYDYSGNLLSEVDLSAIYEKYTDTVHCQLVFADGSCVYILVNRGMDNSTSTLLYQIAWEEGGLREVTGWPGADVIYDGTPSGEWQVGASNLASLSSRERELKKEGTLRGEIEITHELPLGLTELSAGDAVLFHIDTRLEDSNLKITLTGAKTGTTLEGSVTGSGDISFEITIADEYRVVLENCSTRSVRFTIDYSFGGST